MDLVIFHQMCFIMEINNIEIKNILSQFNTTIYTYSDYSSTNFIFSNPYFIMI